MTLLTSTSYQDTHPLKPLVHSLGQIVTNSEDDFLSLGMNLQKIQMMSSSQRQKISAAMDLFKANDDVGVMQQISAYVQQSQQDTQTAQQTATNLCADLTTMMKLLDEIAKKGRTLEQAGLFLHVIGINTGIECARQQQMAAMFTVVSRDTIVLAGQIRDATVTLFDKTTQAKNEQKKTLIEAQKSIESLDQLARGSEQATETALSKVAELIDYSISMVNEAKRMSGSITTEINRVVMGIQFHDNLRQRIEHVNSALLETETLHADPSAELVCNTYLSVELQKAQLDSLICELETLYTTQSQALGNIVQEVSGLETRLESMASEQSTGTSQDDPVAVLLTGIESLERLNCDSQVLAETIRTSAERAEQIVGDMHDAVKSTFVIANSVKINALNAIIKAAKFGRHGESLQVLAQGMVTVSCDTRELINIFNELLEQLSGLTRKEAGEVDEQKDLSADVDFDSAQVQQVFHDFRAELLSSHRDCRSLAQNLENEQRSLISISNLKDALQLHINQLGHYLESIQPQDAELLATMRKSFGEQLEGRYTMNEERDIHRHLLQQSAASPVTTQAVNSGDSDDCLFFDQPVAETPPATEE
ncbi:MAG: hypothetical protein U9R69_06520, partial [Thermodesulfobacteriota bacterium]|nr:hypothetical protein [Thermodesulfobacteriota bacterium]